jgi:hypothetical protein
MQDNANSELPAPTHMPWNKGKLTGAKPPLRQKHVWAIRTKLQIEQRTRDLALFNLAIDSKLRGCDRTFSARSLPNNTRIFREVSYCLAARRCPPISSSCC